MESSDRTMEEFLKDLDTINAFCDERAEGPNSNFCNSCPLNDYCIAIPTRSSVEDLIRHAKKCVEIIKNIKGGNA